jgi:fatty acid desaturase
MAKLVEKHLLRAAHRPSWAGFRLAILYAGAYFGCLAGVWAALEFGAPLALVPLALVQAFVMHAYLLALHEAAHGGLCPVGFVNGYLGRVTGAFSFISLTLFRAAHHGHHAHIGTPRDDEFWPFADHTTSKRLRRASALLALTVGMVWTPFVLLRSFFHPNSHITDSRTRRLIWLELAGMVAFWAVTVALAVHFELVPVLVFGFLVPAFVAGNVHTWRQFVEHIGLTDSRNTALTRSVRNPSRFGRWLSWLLFEEPLHDVHHLYPKVPAECVPTVAEAEVLPPELPVFRSYTAAVLDFLPHLADPKFGKGWPATDR